MSTLPDATKLPDILTSLPTPRLGSFGEYIFKETFQRVRSLAVEDYHRDQSDFLIGARRVDVKTTRLALIRGTKPERRYRAKRLPDVLYAVVAFELEGALVALEQEVIDSLDWRQLSALWVAWGQRRRTRPATERMAPDLTQWKPIAADLTAFFAQDGYRARLLRRTCQQRFGKQSPHNLLPNEPTAGVMTVYLDFADRVAPDTVRRIIAFPDSRKDELPRLAIERNYLPTPGGQGKYEKVDLDRMPKNFVYSDIIDLKARWRAMLAPDRR